MCNFWNFGHLPCFMSKYGNFKNGPISLLNRCPYIKNNLNLTPPPPQGRKRVYVQLLEPWPMAKLVLKQSVKAYGPLVIGVHLQSDMALIVAMKPAEPIA